MTDPIAEIEKRHAAVLLLNDAKPWSDIDILLAEVKRLRAALVGLGYTYNRYPVVPKEVEG